MAATAKAFNLANPHALSSIVHASATRRIVASQDIFDDHGTKLWARDQPVSHSLHERLLERKLKQPLEACLRAEDGVTNVELHAALAAFLDSGQALAQAVLPWGDRLRAEVKRLPLHSAVQLLLTTAHATKPAVFDHAIRGMALAGAMQLSAKTANYDLRLAMLGGLLHDLGEMYVNPKYLDGDQTLDAHGYRHVVTHPRIGELLLATMTDYPAALARAVGEHHERLDGSGYPLQASLAAVSPLGQLLAVTETALGIAAEPKAPLARISVALRMVPGEYDPGCIGFIAWAAARAQEDLQPEAPTDPRELFAHLELLGAALTEVIEQARSLAEQPDASAVVKDVASKASARAARLRVGANAIGLWGPAADTDSPQSLFELTLALQEMRYRLKCIARNCLWPHPDFGDDDAARLAALWSVPGA